MCKYADLLHWKVAFALEGASGLLRLASVCTSVRVTMTVTHSEAASPCSHLCCRSFGRAGKCYRAYLSFYSCLRCLGVCLLAVCAQQGIKEVRIAVFTPGIFWIYFKKH